jgi:transposase-like protein
MFAMDREWLEAQLGAGRSIQSIAREVGRDPSTVAYWVNKHGLASQHAARHAPRGGLSRKDLLELVQRGLSIRQIASERGVSATTIRFWLRKHQLQTAPLNYRRRGQPPEPTLRECTRHGWTAFVPAADGSLRCPRCASDAVSERRRRVKATLVDEAGGRCRLCGYDRYPGALHFHHLDPGAKSFGIGGTGATPSLAKLRREATKCVLLCANCHAEVEAGVARITVAQRPG